MIKSVKLGEVARISSGGTPSRANPSYWNGNIPWVKTTQIQNCVITLQDVDEWITEEGLKNSSAKMVPAGTIVLGMIGQGKTRGQVGYLSFDACTNQNAATITCNNECNSWFIYQYLLFNYENIRALSNSSGQGNLNLGLVEIIPITLPPLLQQKKIANLLGTWDNAIEKTEALITAKEKQFEWLLNNLIEDDFKSCKKTLSEYASIAKKEKILSADGEKLLTVKLHCKGIEPNTRDIKVVLSSKGRPYYQRLAGEFLIGRQNFHNGGFGIVSSELDGFIASNAITTLELNQQKLMPEYLFFHFSRKNYYLRVGHIMDGTGQKELSDKQIMKLPISTPSIKIQQDIVLKLSSAKEEIKLLQTLIEKYRSQKRGLMQKLLTGEWQVSTGAEGVLQELSKERTA